MILLLHCDIKLDIFKKKTNKNSQDVLCYPVEPVGGCNILLLNNTITYNVYSRYIC